MRRLGVYAAAQAYCEARWRQGIKAASEAAVVLAARISDDVPNQVPARVTSLSDADRYDPAWQRTPGTPVRILLAGQTLVALLPPPDATVRTLTLDLVRNAPVPTAGGSDREQHLGEDGGAEQDQTQHEAAVQVRPEREETRGRRHPPPRGESARLDQQSEQQERCEDRKMAPE